MDNLKCSGCANTISKAVASFNEVSNILVDVEHESVSFEHPDQLEITPIKDKLRNLGYPEKGSLEGIGKMAANAKSYVSCAIGKITK